VYPFSPRQTAGIAQAAGPIDAFRVVKVPTCAAEPAVFGSLAVITDAEGLPQDFESKLYKMLGATSHGVGRMLTVSFRSHSGKNRRLSPGNVNDVVIDFDTAGFGDLPSRAQMRATAMATCSLLDTKECAQRVSFKSDTTGAAVEIELDLRSPSAPPTEDDWSSQRAAAVVLVFGLVAICSSYLGYKLLFGGLVNNLPCKWRSSQPTVVAPADAKPGQSEEIDRDEDKKPEIMEDNASTMTPDSFTSGRMEDVALDDSSVADQV
jgi:hypothetical protein